MRVLFADKLPDAARFRLASHGFEVRAEPGLHGAALVEVLGSYDPEVLVVRSTQVEAAHVQAGSALTLVVRAGAGVNTIDVDACSRRGVFVANCPGKNGVAVAELTMALILASDRSVPDAVADLRAGRWNKSAYGKARGLKGRTLGVLGLGQIGREVARLGKAFGMTTIGWSRSLTPELADELGLKAYETPGEVARRADVLSVHIAASAATRGLIGDSVFQQMQPGALFVNTARADVVDEDALLRALDTPGIRAALDVFSGEPATGTAPFEHPLARHPHVIGTHHIGASTDQAQEAVAEEACRIIEVFHRTGRVPNNVNVARQSRAPCTLVVRHLDRVGVLAATLGHLRQSGINVQEMANAVFEGGDAAIARIHLSAEPPAAVVDAIRAHGDVLSVSVIALPRESA